MNEIKAILDKIVAVLSTVSGIPMLILMSCIWVN